MLLCHQTSSYLGHRILRPVVIFGNSVLHEYDLLLAAWLMNPHVSLLNIIIVGGDTNNAP